MPKYERLELWSDYQAAGGTPVIDIPDPCELRATFNVEAPDQEGLTFAVPITSRAKSSITSRKVARVVFTDGTFDEWKITKDGAKPLGEDGRYSVTAQPPFFALVECGLYYTTGAGGVRSFAFSLTDVTPSAALTALVLGTPDCPSWIGLGTITPTVRISISGEFQTPAAIALAIRDAVRGAGIGCELRIRRNGTTQYLIDLVTSVGSSATTPEVRVAKQLIDYVHEHDTQRQATRIIPRGPVDATGVDATLARARFKVTAVNGGTLRITVADDAGGGGPIAYNEQYVGWYVFREKTGRTFQIVHTYAATQEIELASVSDMAAHSVTAPEWITFRLTEALNGTRRIGAFGTYKASPFQVTAVDGGTKKLTLADNWPAFGWGDPVKANGEHVDWKVRRATYAGVTPTGFNPTAGFVGPLSSVAGIAVGMWAISRDATAAPYQYRNGVLVVDAIDSGTKILTVHVRDTGTPVTQYAGGAAPTWEFWTEVATQHLVTASDAAANTVTVDAVGTAAANDIVEFLQPCQGTLPYYVESPTDVASYGKKIATLGRAETGETNLVPNACMRTWTTPTNPPDGWTRNVLSGSPTHSKETTITRQGGASYLVQLYGPASAASSIYTPPAKVHPVTGASTLSARLKLYFTAASLAGQATCIITVRRVDAAGNALSAPAAWGTANTLTIGGVDNSLLPEENLVETGQWVDVAFHGLDVLSFVNEFVRIEIAPANTGNVDVYIDGAQITQTVTAPREEPALLIEFSEATKLLQVALLELIAWASPPVVFSMTAADLYSLDPTRFSEDAITLGGTMRAIDPDNTVDVSLRLMEFSPDYLDPAGATYVLATLPALLSARLAGGGSGATSTITASATAVGGGAVAWDAIAGKPTTFPPAAHSHVWPDILAAVAGQGPRVSVGRMDSSGDLGTSNNGEIAILSGSPGAVTDILRVAINSRVLAVVSGQYNNTDAFMDLVSIIETGGYSVGVIASVNVKGTAKPRVYSSGANGLKLGIDGGGANSYAVRVVALVTLPPA